MHYFLFILLLTFWLPVYAAQGSRGAVYQEKPVPEKVQLQLSEEVIASGATLWFRGFLLGDSAESKVLYVELMSREGAVVQGIYPIRKGVAQGQFSLPDTLSGGWYQVRAYTQWMRNFGESTFWSHPLLVINPYADLEKSASPPAAPEDKEPARASGSGLTVALDQTQVRPREPVSVTIGLKDPSSSVRVAVSVRKVNPLARYFPADGPAPSPSPPAAPARYDREDEGLTLSGTVSGMPASTADRAVVLSVPGLNPYFEYDLADQKGHFRIPIREALQGQQTIILQTANTSLLAQWSLDEKFAPQNTYPPEGFPKVSASALKAVQQTYAQRARVNAQYELFRPRDSVAVSDQPDFRFYGAPNYTIRADEYIELPNFVEVNRELMPGIRLRKNKGAYNLDVFDAGPRDFLEGEPTVFIDGVLIWNVDYLVSLPPSQIELIETVNRRTYYGEYRFDGTVAIYTASGDAYLPALSPSALRQPVTGYTPYQPFTVQDSLPSYEPDLRTLLYWEPLVEIKHTPYNFTIFNADELGTFEVVVEGFAEDGRRVEGRVRYTVSLGDTP